MLKLNNLSKEQIQVLGSHKGVNVNGFAHAVRVTGNENKVWHYDLKFFIGKALIKVKSNPKEGTLTNESRLLSRIQKVVEKELDSFGGAKC